MERRIERFDKYMKAKGLNDNKVTIDLGLSKGTLGKSRMENRDLSERNAQKVLDFYTDLNRTWLLTGEGEMLTASNEENEPQPKISYTKGQPYYDVDFMAGFDIMVNDQTTLPKYNIDFAPYNHDGVLWCNVTGNSMQPLISSGDIIAIKRMLEWKDFILYGEVYGVVTNDLRTIKIVTKSSKGDEYVRLVPANPSSEYQPQDLPVKLITQMYKIVGCMHRF